MIFAPSEAAWRIIVSALPTLSSGLIEHRIWTKPSFSMEFTRVDQPRAQRASCNFFSIQFSLGFARDATEVNLNAERYSDCNSYSERGSRGHALSFQGARDNRQFPESR